MEVPDSGALFSRIASDLQNDGWCVIPQALAPFALADDAVCQAYAPAKVVANGRGARRLDARTDSTAWLDHRSEAQTNWITWCEQLQIALNRSLFLGLHEVESHFALYRPGDRYSRHLDSTARFNARVVSMIVYLNAHWNEGDGGELLLYSRTGELIRRVAPAFGTLVVFLSAQFPHEVMPAVRDRYSVATWLRRRSVSSTVRLVSPHIG